MCVYCMIGDYTFRFDPPWNPPYPSPLIPLPMQPEPITPWTHEKLADFYDLLRRVKDLEDKVGCPCEPNKADYLTVIRERLEQIEAKVAENSDV